MDYHLSVWCSYMILYFLIWIIVKIIKTNMAFNRLLTINNHLFLHKIFVKKTADFTSISSAQLCCGPHYFKSSMFLVTISSINLICQVKSTIREQMSFRLRSSPRKPLKKWLRVISKKPFHIYLSSFTFTGNVIVTIKNHVILLPRFNHWGNSHFPDLNAHYFTWKRKQINVNDILYFTNYLKPK